MQEQGPMCYCLVSTLSMKIIHQSIHHVPQQETEDPLSMNIYQLNRNKQSEAGLCTILHLSVDFLGCLAISYGISISNQKCMKTPQKKQCDNESHSWVKICLPLEASQFSPSDIGAVHSYYERCDKNKDEILGLNQSK